MIPFLVFILPLVLFLSFPSTLWNFDGVACAAALELGKSTYFFHANHLLYGFLGYTFWSWIGIPLGISRALPALQVFTSLCSALGLVGLYRLLHSVLKDKSMALLLTLSLATTAAFWVWSVEAQVYTLAFLSLAWATFFLLAGKSRHNPIWIGLLHGGAILGHVIHILWLVPAIFWMHKDKKALLRYGTTLVLTTLVPYILVINFVIAPALPSQGVLIWLKGSAGLTPDRSWLWHWPGWTGGWIWLKSTCPVLWGSFWPYENTPVTPWLWLITGLSILLMAFLLFQTLKRSDDRLTRFAWLWIAAYGLFLSTWEPQTLCYRITDILPLGILLALAIRPWKRERQFQVLVALLVTTLVPNALTRILPMRHAESNKIYQETLRLSKITPPDALFITEGGLPLIYLPYFAAREAWHAGRIPPDRLKSVVAQEARRRSVYIQKGSTWEKIQ